VLPHIVLAQAATPHLKDVESSSYLIITGRMGEECLKADEALLSISNAAIYGVSAALRAELSDARVAARIAELRLGAVIRRDSADENPAFPGWRAQPASALASVIVDAMRSCRGGVCRVSEEMVQSAPRERRREAPLFQAGGVEAGREAREQVAMAQPGKRVVAVPAVYMEEEPGHYSSQRYSADRGSYGGAASTFGREGGEAVTERDEGQGSIMGKVGGALERGMERIGITTPAAQKE